MKRNFRYAERLAKENPYTLLAIESENYPVLTTLEGMNPKRLIDELDWGLFLEKNQYSEPKQYPICFVDDWDLDSKISPAEAVHALEDVNQASVDRYDDLLRFTNLEQYQVELSGSIDRSYFTVHVLCCLALQEEDDPEFYDDEDQRVGFLGDDGVFYVCHPRSMQSKTIGRAARYGFRPATRSYPVDDSYIELRVANAYVCVWGAPFTSVQAS